MTDSYRLFGQAMLEHLRGSSGRLTFVRDDGYRDPSDVRPYFAPFSQWSLSERRAVRQAKGHVLDIGCGAGRVALYLQRRGFDVTAIDISPEAVESARLRGVRNAIAMDARRLSFPDGRFDTIVMFGNNLGICGDLGATRRLFLKAHRMVRRGGHLLASSGVPAVWEKAHASYIKENVRRGRSPGLMRLKIVYRGRHGSWFSVLFLGTDDLLRLCATTGWDVEEVFLEPKSHLAHYAFTAVRA